MKKKLNSFINSSIVLSILLIILGIFAICMPSITLRTFSIFISIYLIIHGIFLMAINMKSRMLYFPVDTLISGVLSLILGLLLLFYPNMLNIIIPIVVGVFIILHSINNLNLVINFRKGLSTGNFLATLLLTILELILGVLVLLNPWVSAMTMTVFVGTIMIIYSIINLMDMIIFKRNMNKIFKKFQQKIEEVERISIF